MTNPYLAVPRDKPLQFQDSTGEWHLFGEQWFAEHSEHVTLSHTKRLADLFDNTGEYHGNSCK